MRSVRDGAHPGQHAEPVEQSRAFARASGAGLLELPGVGHFEVIDPAHESWSQVVEWIGSL